KSGHLKEYEWRPADSIDDSSLPVSEAVATDSRSTALAVQLLETIRGMDAFDSYERAVHTFPHGLLVVIATPEVGREYCVPINGANIFKDKYIEVGDDDVERYIERAAQIEGAVFVNNARQELVTTNLALDNKLPRPLEGGLRHYMGLPEGSGMKTIRAAAMARYTPAAALVVRTPKREKPFEAYAMYDDQILKSEPKKQRSRIWPISGVLSYSRR
ncbi:MAG: hypothetical protein HZB66_02675, partial [Candidatus Aenigmarchaeota archaeon]|nr:hypothetical protein [Candidatus Aenigmarchaeota archaeon]